MHFVALIVTAALFFSAGWALCAFFITSSYAADISDLQAERQLIDEERDHLHRSWQRLAVFEDEPQVELDLGRHKHIPVS